MSTSMRWLAAMAVGLFLGGWQAADAADPAPTKITVPEMDCPSCAKKIGGKVAGVPGVGNVEYSVEARTLTVTPKAGAALSPKALWEAVLAGGMDPSKLDGPTGVFTSRPKN